MTEFENSPTAWLIVLIWRIIKWSMFAALLVAWCNTKYCHNQMVEACQIVGYCD